MNVEQRIRAALGFQPVDRIPVVDWIDEPTVLKLARLLGFSDLEVADDLQVLSGDESEASLTLLARVMRELALDATWQPYSLGLQPIDQDYARDKYGRVYFLSSHGQPFVKTGPIESPADIRGYDMAGAFDPKDLEKVVYLQELLGQEGVVWLDMVDPFQEAWTLRGGMDKLLLDFMENPGLVHDLGKVITEYKLAVLEAADRDGIGFIMMGGDLAGEKTTLMSPDQYREFVRPYQQQVVDAAKARGMKIIKHSDGNVWPILEDFYQVGYDGFNPIQPQCMDIGEVKSALTGKMCVIGNIDCRELLPAGTPEEVADTVKQTIDVAAPGGGYILSSSNSLHPGCRPENILAMIQTAHDYGRKLNLCG